MDEQIFTDIIELITQRTGIIPRDSHRTGIKNYSDKQLKAAPADNSYPHTYEEYFNSLQGNQEEMINLINSATVNETYFFREEAQFQLLQSKVFPMLVAGSPTKRLRIWSAASSSGEEIYSLLLLADAMNIKTECIASDINTRVLDTCAKGVYKKNAIRTVDGAAYHHLLEPYKLVSGGFELPKKITDRITRKQINLSRLTDFPKNQDIIFIRNVFIYFSTEMKKAILAKIAEEALAPGGYLFVSMNEVASIDIIDLPAGLEKAADGKVFYFRKAGL